MPQAGDIIELQQGPYRLLAPLGGSSYGQVWRAEGRRRDVALKFVNQERMQAAMPEQRARWIESAETEIAFLRSLSPWDERHIVRLLDSGSHQGLPVMALELMDGDLGSHVARERQAGRPLPLAKVAGWIEQLNQALAKVHQYGWRYLDLKPANLLLTAGQRRVKLADFGTNRQLADHAAHSYAGTANWQAPEQFFPDADLRYRTSARSDYFALGALFYFLVCGGVALRFCSECGKAYREHQSGGAFVVRERHGRASPPTLRDDEAAFFVHRIERELREDALPGNDGRDAAQAALTLLRTLLHADPEQRPANALAISRMLARIHAALPAVSLHATMPAPARSFAELLR